MHHYQQQCQLNLDELKDSGSFKGYASIFDVQDAYGDIIVPGAFTHTLLELGNHEIKLLWQHDPKHPIGIITRAKEDKRGLYIEGKLLLEVEKGREAYNLLKENAINGLSIGFTPYHYSYNPDGTRTIMRVKLYEISLVTFPANTQATITEVKDMRTLEHLVASLKSAQNTLLSTKKRVEELESRRVEVIESP